MTRIGILSDTHLTTPDERFKAQVEACFSDISLIVHAGDLTSASILEAFGTRTIFGVHGNMCDPSSRTALPASRRFEIEGYRLAVAHGYGFGYGGDIEDRLFNEYGDGDCIIYGHTHSPVVHTIGDVLIINPGSFRSTGRHGSGGTYAILELGKTMNGRILNVPEIR